MEDILDDVSENKYFYVANGMVVKNLNDMCAILDLIDKDTFDKHVNKEKNDFSNWARAVYNDELADSLEKAKTKRTMLRRVKEYIRSSEAEDMFLDVFGWKLEKFLAGLIIGCLFGISLGIFLSAFFF